MNIGDLVKVIKLKDIDSEVNVTEYVGETGKIISSFNNTTYGKMYEIEFDNTNLSGWDDGLHFHEEELEKINKELELLKFIESYLEIEIKPYQKMTLEEIIKDMYKESN